MWEGAPDVLNNLLNSISRVRMGKSPALHWQAYTYGHKENSEWAHNPTWPLTVKANQLGSFAFSHFTNSYPFPCQQYATQLVWERMKLLIEPTAGVGVAAVLSQHFQTVSPEVKNICIVLSGGNADLTSLTWVKQAERPAPYQSVSV